MRLEHFARLGFLTVGVLSAALLFGEENAVQRLETSETVFKEIMAAPDKGIPQDLLESSQCIVIVPGMKKAAFVVGGNYGRGFMLCRLPTDAGWSAPAGIRMEGGSFGFQIGGSETDVIMLVRNKRGAEKLLSSKFTLGADASVAAGPVGRTTSADTDLKLHAEILSYSRARGVFAGVSLDGATLRPDNEANTELYGRKVTNEELIRDRVRIQAPLAASRLWVDLNKYSARKEAQKH